MMNIRTITIKPLLILFAVVLLCIFSSCQAAGKNVRLESSQVTSQHLTFTPQANNQVALPNDVLENCAQETARKIEEFQKIKDGMSFREICKIVGTPDHDFCSGIYCYSYSLDNGTKIVVSFTSFDEPAKVQFP